MNDRLSTLFSLLGAMSLALLLCFLLGCDGNNDEYNDSVLIDDDTEDGDDDLYHDDDSDDDDSSDDDSSDDDTSDDDTSDDDTSDDDSSDDDTVDDVRINCGGPEIFIDELVYFEDTLFNSDLGYGAIGDGETAEYPVSELGGWSYADCGAANRPDKRLGTMRRAADATASFGYRFLVEGNQPRPLRLIFAEPMAVLPATAPFDVLINGTVVLDNIDLGSMNAVQHIATFGISALPVDGVIEVTLLPKSGALLPVTLSAIELLHPLNELDASVAAPDDLTVYEGIEAIALRWTAQEARRLAGYRVYKDNLCLTQPLLPFNDDGVVQFRDFAATPGVSHTYRVEAVDLDGTVSAASATVTGAALSADILSLPFLELTIAADDLLTLALDPSTEEHVPGTFTFFGNDEDAEFHYRGSSTTRMFAKRSWKVHLVDESYFDHDEVNLKSSWLDNTFLQEWSMDFVADQLLDIVTYDVGHAAVFLNGAYNGLYVEVEEVDGTFLARHNHNDAGCLLEAEFFSFDLQPDTQYLNQKNGGGECLDNIWDFTNALHQINENEVEMFLSQNVDLVKYLQFRAVNVLLGNADFLFHNFFLFQDPSSGLWELIPKDNDFLWSGIVPTNYGSSENPVDDMVDYLFDKAYSLDSFRYAYAKQLLFLRQDLDDLGLPDELGAQSQTLADAVYGDLRKPEMTCSIEFDSVANTCQTQLDRIHQDDFTQQITNLVLTEYVGQILNELVAVNQSVVTDEYGEYEPYLEIHNLTGMPMFLRGLSISDDPNQPRKYQMPDVTIEPWGFALFFCDGDTKHGDGHLPAIIYPEGGWIGLYEIAEFGGQLIDQIDYPALEANQACGRESDQLSDLFSVLSQPSPGIWNGGGSTIWHFPKIQNMRTDPHPPQALTPINLVAAVTDVDGDLFAVEAFADSGEGWITFDMFDDGAHGDGSAGDGIFGGEFPDCYEANTLVRYYLRAQDAAGHAAFMPAGGSTNPAFFPVGIPAVVINELMADNETVWTDEYGEYEDWIEIAARDGSGSVDLGVFFLSDDPSEPMKWQLPDVQLGEGEYALIYADKDLEQGIWHTSFKMDKDGESILIGVSTILGYYLVDSFSYDEIGEDQSYARSPDKTGPWTLLEAVDITPGAMNPAP